MTHDEFIKQVTEMRDRATAQVNKFKDGDTDDEFSKLNYFHGQQVALNQVLGWVKILTPQPQK